MLGIAFASGPKLKQLLGTAKDKIPKHQKSGIYKVTCKACNCEYLGQSKRQVLVRYEEHIRHIKKNRPNKSAVALHAIKNLHLNINDYTLSLVKPVNENYKLDAWESLIIQKVNKVNSNLMNVDPSPIISPLFNYA